MLASHSYRPQSMEWIWDWCSTARFCSSWWTCSFGLLSDASCSLLISCFGFLMLDYCDLDHQSPQKSAHQAVLGHHSSLSARFLCSLSCLFSCLRLCSPCRRSFLHWSSTVSSGLVVLSWSRFMTKSANLCSEACLTSCYFLESRFSFCPVQFFYCCWTYYLAVAIDQDCSQSICGYQLSQGCYATLCSWLHFGI